MRADSDPDEAEVQMRKVSDEYNRIEEDLAVAEERADEFEEKLLATTSEADREQLLIVVQMIESEIEGLKRDLEDASHELGSQHEYWFGED